MNRREGLSQLAGPAISTHLPLPSQPRSRLFSFTLPPTPFTSGVSDDARSRRNRSASRRRPSLLRAVAPPTPAPSLPRTTSLRPNHRSTRFDRDEYEASDEGDIGPPRSKALLSLPPNSFPTNPEPESFDRLKTHLRCHQSDSMALAFLLRDSIDSVQKFRDETIKYGPEFLCSLAEIIDKCLTHCRLGKEHMAALRLIQDFSVMSLHIPSSYWITGVKIGERIAGGGEATIYAGTHHGRKVVIRQFHPPKSNDWEQGDNKRLLKLIIREIILHRQLSHKNIVPFVGVYQPVDSDGTLGSAPVMVLQRIEHKSVKAYLDKKSSRNAFVRIMIGIIDGLMYLHERKPPVIHGDVHDGNVLVDAQGIAKLCDLGLGRIRYEITRTLTSIRQGGAFRFVAPELSIGPGKARPNEASDTYSAAMTIYSIGTGMRPFVDDREIRAAWLAQQGYRPARPTSFRGLSDFEISGVWRILSQMWHREPTKRPSMKMVRQDFCALFGIPTST